jgi:hypothetical protein
MKYLNESFMQNFSNEAFRKKWPFPWENIQGFLNPDGFQALHKDFPPLDLFEYHENLPRVGGGRPHNRYYLAYEKSKYQNRTDVQKGVVQHEDLAPSWQEFMEELHSTKYQNFIKGALNVPQFTVRFAWHIGKSSSEVSPHVDTQEKLGTQIFYFNTSEDWNNNWGGSLLILGGKLVPDNKPNFEDFTTSEAINILDNRSFLFKNIRSAWHGVKTLKCPEGKYRKLFNVIFDVPQKPCAQ